jgi:hypothetical protein
MGAKIIEFPKNRNFTKMDTKNKEISSFLKPEKKVKRIYDIKRDEEREDQMFPPNFLTLITLGKPN